MTTRSQSSESKFEILIVEDSPTQAQRLRYLLEQQSYRVTAAVNGRLALEAVVRSKPTLIISDVVMPEMDGYELCRRVKSDPSLADIPIILVTTLSDPQDVIRGLECGADNFILKPYQETQLLSRLRFVIANRKTQDSEHDRPVEIDFAGQRNVITAGRLQILRLLLSTYDAAIQRNKELQIANRALEDANEELEAFSYSVSHDLRAPVRHINGFSRMLADSYAADLPAPARQLIDRISNAGQRLGQLIDALLNLSRLSRQHLVKTTVNLTNLVEEVLEILEPERQGRNVEVRVGPLTNCSGDPSLLRQVFANLLSNAFKFTREREKAIIEVDCLEEGDEVHCIVRDNGVGFDMAHAPTIFGVFQRFHEAEQFEGTGIGLSIVRRIIQRHGGHISVEAEVNRGATFRFSLPAETRRNL